MQTIIIRPHFHPYPDLTFDRHISHTIIIIIIIFLYPYSQLPFLRKLGKSSKVPTSTPISLQDWLPLENFLDAFPTFVSFKFISNYIGNDLFI
jgi:hypothetical protein